MNSYEFEGVLAANCLMPTAEFKLKYQVLGNELIATIEYKLADYIKSFPRFGIEFGVDKAHGNFSYAGFGPSESYVDKHVAYEYGYYVSSAEENYEYEYIRPQESGNHYACKYLAVKDLFKVTAEKPFSCSVNPFTTKQLRETLHSFELEENDFVNVCILKAFISTDCNNLYAVVCDINSFSQTCSIDSNSFSSLYANII